MKMIFDFQNILVEIGKDNIKLTQSTAGLNNGMIYLARKDWEDFVNTVNHGIEAYPDKDAIFGKDSP